MWWQRIAAVAIGGAAGAVCRYLVGAACAGLLGHRFAYGTLAVNVVGCFLIGLLLQGALIPGPNESQMAHPAVIVGFLGALTTFSTFGYETVRFLEAGSWQFALLNVLANLALGVLAVIGGGAVAKTYLGAG